MLQKSGIYCCQESSVCPLDTVDSTEDLLFEAVPRADVTGHKLLPWMWLRSALQTYCCWLPGGDMKVLDPVSMLLRQKNGDIFSIPSDGTVYSAIELMADKRIGALLVVDDGHLVGVISERDYARKVI